jgi:hypothetical protein
MVLDPGLSGLYRIARSLRHLPDATVQNLGSKTRQLTQRPRGLHQSSVSAGELHLILGV